MLTKYIDIDRHIVERLLTGSVIEDGIFLRNLRAVGHIAQTCKSLYRLVNECTHNCYKQSLRDRTIDIVVNKYLNKMHCEQPNMFVSNKIRDFIKGSNFKIEIVGVELITALFNEEVGCAIYSVPMLNTLLNLIKTNSENNQDRESLNKLLEIVKESAKNKVLMKDSARKKVIKAILAEGRRGKTSLIQSTIDWFNK